MASAKVGLSALSRSKRLLIRNRKIVFADDGNPRLSDGNLYGPREWDYSYPLLL